MDQYADVCGRQRIETRPDDNCLTRAFATALQIDFQSKLDWRKVLQAIRKELNYNKDYYKEFCTNKEPERDRSLADVLHNALGAVFRTSHHINVDKDYDPDVWINAAANALKVHVVLVHLSKEQLPVERNFEPRLSESDETVYIAYHCCGHQHFDALVKKSNL